MRWLNQAVHAYWSGGPAFWLWGVGISGLPQEGGFAGGSGVGLELSRSGKAGRVGGASRAGGTCGRTTMPRDCLRVPPEREEPVDAQLLAVISEESHDRRYVLPVSEAEAKIRAPAVAPGSWTLGLPKYLPHSQWTVIKLKVPRGSRSSSPDIARYIKPITSCVAA